MASGFDSSSFSTGLLNSIASQNNAASAQAREEALFGDKEQVNAFQEAAKEYDSEKQKKADQGTKIDALANIVSNGSPNPAAYAVARDAVEMGYTGQEHLPYVMDAYKRTMQDYVDNPEKWTGVKPQSADPQWQQTFNNDQPDDSNPSQTAALRRSGNQQPMQNLEDIRNRNVPNPHGDLPAGKWSSDPNAIFAGEAGKAQAMAGVKQDIVEQKEVKQNSDYMLNNPDTPLSNSMPSTGMQQPPPNAQGQQTGSQPAPVSPLAVNASELQPPGQPKPTQVASAQTPPSSAVPAVSTTEGINIDAAAPQETTQNPAQVGAEAVPSTPATGLNTDYMKQLQAKNPTAAGIVQQVANGEIQISPMMLRDRADGSKSSWQAVIEAAHKYDPSFDMTDYNARNKMHSGYTGGQDHQNIMRLDTATGHLGTLYIAGKDLDTGNVQGLNRAAQALGVAVGQSPKSTYDAIAIRVAPEIVTAYTPTGGSDADRAQSEKAFAAAMSGPQRENSLRATADLLHSRMAAVQNAWDSNMGPSKAGKDWFTPNTHAVMGALGVNEADKTPFLTMQQLQQQGQHPLNPNLDKQQPVQLHPQQQQQIDGLFSQFGVH